MRRISALLALSLLSGCAPASQAPKTDTPQAQLVVQPASFADLPGWAQDDHRAALVPFAKSCERIRKMAPDKSFFSAQWSRPLVSWQAACAVLPNPVTATSEQARLYFENYFTPMAATADGKAEGLFTGYYEPSLRGSRIAEGPFQIPLRAKPDDLVMVNLGEFRDELKGQRIAGRVKDGLLKPYEDRAAIEDGKLPPPQDKPLIYVDDAVGAFFLQIQGSGVVSMTDGSTIRVGYDGQNGHPYYAIGKELVKRGYLKQDDVSMQSIRAWLMANPVEGKEIMRSNKSYVFFREQDKDGAVGAEGLTLTPGRSLAVDHSVVPYGLPLYVDLAGPRAQDGRIRRLMVAQDTGGAIRGPVRGDVFWGFGPEAEAAAGVMKSPGRYWFLLPKS